MATAEDENAYQAQKLRFEQELIRLDEPLKAGLFGAGHKFTLVDAAYAMLFMRARCLAEVHPQGQVEMPQSIADWAGELLSLPSVKSSVVEDFSEKYQHFLRQKGS
jgi:glutathione S-transferase